MALDRKSYTSETDGRPVTATRSNNGTIMVIVALVVAVLGFMLFFPRNASTPVTEPGNTERTTPATPSTVPAVPAPATPKN
jgi:hypothetical protein